VGKDTLQQAVENIRDLVLSHDAPGLSDSFLLERFLNEHEEAAFEALLRRHGPLVYGVCRRVLRNSADADDAFQATFLVFVRKAASIARPDQLSNWLYGVAYTTSRAARAATIRRHTKEAQVTPRQATTPDLDLDDIYPVLDDELSRLPVQYRAPLVLCELEGKSRKHAAKALGLPEGTLSSRLARGRALLASRLSRRGVAVTGAVLTTALAEQASAAALPAGLLQATMKAGTLMYAGKLATGSLISAKVLQLSEKTLRIMLLAKLKVTCAILLVSCFLCVGAGVLASHGSGVIDSDRIVSQAREAAPGAADDAGRTKLVRDSLTAAEEIEDPETRVQILLGIADGQLQLGDREEAGKTAMLAFATLREVPQNRAKVQALIRVARIHDVSAGRATALEFFKVALKSADALLDQGEKTSARLELISALAAVGAYEDASRIADASVGYQTFALSELASQICKNSKKLNAPAARNALEHAQTIVVRSIDRLTPPEAILPTAGAYAVFPGAWAHLGDFQRASYVLKEILVALPEGDKSIKANSSLPARFVAAALQSIAVEQVKSGDLDGAKQTITRMHFPGDTAGAFVAVAAEQIRAGERAAAKKTLESLGQLIAEIQTAVQKRTDVQHGAGEYRSEETANEWRRQKLAEFQAKLGDFDAALKTAQRLTFDFNRTEVFLATGKAQLAANEKAEAKKTLRRASRTASKLVALPSARGLTADAHLSFLSQLLLEIAQAQARAGDIEEAHQTLEDIPNQKDQRRDLLVVAQAQGGDLKGALEALPQIKTRHQRAYVLEKLAGAMARAGDEDGAVALAAKQSSPEVKARILLAVALARAKVEEGEQ
jgi:RNA polymerase sigma factor (sigma-70 family)